MSGFNPASAGADITGHSIMMFAFVLYII